MLIFSGIKLDKDTKALFRNLYRTTFELQNQNISKLDVGISIIKSEEMQKLNKEMRGIDYATDVLSFPALDDVFGKKIDKKNFPFDINPENDKIYVGDIIINIDKAHEQAEEYGHSFERELCYLFVHGLHHILGFDHIEEDDRKLMRKMEEEVLLKYNIKREE